MAECTPNHPSCAKTLGAAAGRFCGVCGQGNPNYVSIQSPMTPSSVTAQSTNRGQAWSIAGLRADLLSTLRANNAPGSNIDVQQSIQVIGALIAAIGLLGLISEIFLSSDSPNLAIAGIVILAAAVGLGFLAHRKPEFGVGCAAASFLFVAIGPILLLESSVSDGKPAWAFLLAGLLFATAWVLPGLRGRQSMLGGSLIFGSVGLIALAGQGYLEELTRYGDEIDYSEQDILLEVTRRATTLALILGLACLAIGLRLDRKGWKRVATAFIGIGVLDATLGVYGFSQSRNFDDLSTALLVTAYGLALLLIAAVTGRKATSWIAIAITSSSLVALAASLLGDSSAGATGVVLLIAGAAFVVFISPKASAAVGKITFLQATPLDAEK